MNKNHSLFAPLLTFAYSQNHSKFFHAFHFPPQKSLNKIDLKKSGVEDAAINKLCLRATYYTRTQNFYRRTLLIFFWPASLKLSEGAQKRNVKDIMS